MCVSVDKMETRGAFTFDSRAGIRIRICNKNKNYGLRPNLTIGSLSEGRTSLRLCTCNVLVLYLYCTQLHTILILVSYKKAGR